jgi:hypothetical protein
VCDQFTVRRAAPVARPAQETEFAGWFSSSGVAVVVALVCMLVEHSVSLPGRRFSWVFHSADFKCVCGISFVPERWNFAKVFQFCQEQYRFPKLHEIVYGRI